MKPGRDLDALVAEKVMGAPKCPDDSIWVGPAYSTDIAAAWEVLEKMPERARMAIFAPGAIVSPGRHNGNDWMVRIFSAPDDDSEWDWEKPITVFADSAPHAICLAALKSVGYQFET